MSKEGRGFFLFGALSGLIERARSSAEKESQRLFTSPPQVPATNNQTQPTTPTLRRKQRAAPLLADSLKTRQRPKPPRLQEHQLSERRATQRKRRATSNVSSAAISLPPRASSVMSERTRLAATVDTLAIEDAGDAEDSSAMPVPGGETPKRKRVGAREPMSRLEEEAGLPTKKARPSDVSLGRADSPMIHATSTRSSSTLVSAVAPVATRTTQQPQPAAELAGESWNATEPAGESRNTAEPAVVERERLEKVERELHRLKKIIASLLPDELNDDDLRSVYGDLEEPRVTSDDIIARLMKARFGNSSSSSSTAALPTPTSDSAPRGAPIPPPPPLPPVNMAQLNTAHASAVGSLRGPKDLRRAQTRRGSSDAGPRLGEGSSRISSAATVQRLRADLRPVGKPADSSSLPPPPHKDPSVMAKLLAEMKGHRLRPVKKRPRDM